MFELTSIGSRRVALLVAVLLAAPVASRILAADGESLTGRWHFDVVSPNGKGTRDLSLVDEQGVLTGTIASSTASGPISGKYEGDQIEFTALLSFGGDEFPVVYRATVDGDSMSGTIDFGDYGSGTFTGERISRDPAAATTRDEGAGGEGAVESTPAHREPTPAQLHRPDHEVVAERVGGHFGVEVDGSLVPEMLEFPTGSFERGSNRQGALTDEQPVRTVDISAFSMGRFEVTNAQYLAFCEATGYTVPENPTGWGDYLHAMPDHPVVDVGWDDAVAYADWLSQVTGRTHRLPTEAEWEYAARAGRSGEIWVWGDEWDSGAANTADFHAGEQTGREAWRDWWNTTGKQLSESQPMTTAVGSFPPNAWGLYDLAGNVWEWTSDWYARDAYSDESTTNPGGPGGGREKVLRGGSWFNKPESVRTAVRNRYTPERRLTYNGFRVVSPAP